MKQLTKQLKWYIPGIVLGGIAGLLYWNFYGCDGTCLITSSPWNSMLYGATMGGLANSVMKPSGK
jgi:hypothetical protein